tara:strand:+ start:2420 stop:2875 length:456 start_codon:yes stop_codon:yes gene_type:complete
MAKKSISFGGNMILTTSNWGPYKTFKLMPATNDCPYVEAIFDPGSKILAVISKTYKGSYHMVPKLDDNGDEVKLRVGKRTNGKEIKEQRVMMDTHAEYYITDAEEIKGFVETFGINISKNKYDIEGFLTKDPEPYNKNMSSAKATNLNIVS